MAAVRGRNEGSLYRRKSDGRWIAAVAMPDGSRRTYTRHDKDAGVEALKKLIELRDNATIDGRKLTVGVYLQRWIDGLTGLAPATLRQHRMIVEVHLIPALGKIKLHALTPSAIDRYLTTAVGAETGGKSGKPLDAQTRRHHRATLRRALADAIRDGYAVRNAAALSRAPRLDKAERTYLSGEQIRKLIASTRKERLWPLWTLLANTGLRVSEALGLAWSDVDEKGRTLAVRYQLAREGEEWVRREPKTHKSRRTVPLTSQALDALTVQRARQDELRGDLPEPIDGLVFTDRTGAPIHSTNVLPPFRRALKTAKLPTVTVHDLRHAYASTLLAEGVPLAVISNLLGHTSIRITADTYVHIQPKAARDAVDVLERALS